MSLSFGGITPRPVPDTVTEETLTNLAVPVARRLAFVRALTAFGAALVIVAGGLLAAGYLGRGAGAGGTLGTLIGFGVACLVAAGLTAWAQGTRKTLIRRKYIMPSRTPETIADAWIGVGMMAVVALVILGLAAIFGGPTWPERFHNVLLLLPIALLGPGIVAGLFLITGYTMENQATIFQRWLAKRPLAATEYAELRQQASQGEPHPREPDAPPAV